MVKETISPVIISRLPEFLHEEYPKLIQLLTHYFDWLEEDNNYTRVLLDFKSDLDVGNDSPNYIDEILRDMGFSSTQGLKIKKSHLVYFLKEYYLSQGNETSFKFLFKAFFDEDVGVDYPRHKMAYASNSTFGGRTIIYTTADNHNELKYRRIIDDPNTYFSTTIRGLNTLTTTSIEDLVEFELNGKMYLQISIIPTDSKFLTDEPVEFSYAGATFTETMVPVGQVLVQNPGAGYIVGDIVKAYAPISKQISSGIYIVTRAERGSVDSITIANGGTGYSVGDMIYAIHTKRGAGFSAEVRSVNGSGAITAVTLLNKGWGYDTKPTLYVKTKTGSGAVVQAGSTSIGRILQVEPLHPVVYQDPATVITTTIQTKTGSGAVVYVQPTDTFVEMKKNNAPNNGVLGRNCVLTDSNLFQQFSYELISNVASVEHKPVSDRVHPVGYIRFNVLSLKSGDTYTFKDVQSFFKKIKKLFYAHLLLVSTVAPSDFIRVKLLRSVGLLKPASLSINTLDNHKFSPGLDFYPLDYDYPVIQSLMNHSFMHEAFEAEIRLTTI